MYEDRNYKKNNINIAMIGHKRIPSREGGVEIVVNELATRFVELGHKVTVYNRKGNHVSGKEFNYSKKNIEYFNNKNKGLNIREVFTIDKKGLAALTSSISATLAVIFTNIFNKEKIDCIHYHAEGPSAMVILAHLFGIRTVVTIHGLDWKRAKWGGFAVKYLKFGEHMAAKYADEVIVLSESIKKYFIDTYNRNTVFIPNGINKPKILEANLIKRKWNLSKDQYILYLGRIVPEKGLHYLIEAFKSVKSNKKLVVAGGVSGTEEYVRSIKKLAEKDERILFVDFVQGDILDELYSNAYLYCLPSDLEGMPISLLEAMSYGNCCIVSDIHECTEVIEDKGIIFKKGSVSDLKDALQVCCDKQEIVDKYKCEARGFIIKKYDWNKVVNLTLQLYKGETKYENINNKELSNIY
ncbi:MAG: hypothetical protein PWP67_1844 [Clostridium butyricum]|nr:hypothetical protein [Clostridium butyricum]